jgi:hypothetical protein
MMMGHGSVVRVLIGVLLLLCSVGSGHAQVPAAGNKGAKIAHITDMRGEWTRNGPAFVCNVATKQKLPPTAAYVEMLARACQHMGPFVIGDGVDVLKATLGAPHRTLPQPDGKAALLYFLEQQDHHPYLVATIANNRVIALQVTGPAPAKGYGFNHIDLGATTDALVQVFGQPLHFEPSEEKDTELWTYGVWPFSFEVKAGHVTSIRITEP